MTGGILRSRRVVVGDAVLPAAIHIRHGRISRVGAWEDTPPGADLEDVGDLVVMAGLVDTHVHINEPGRTHWEGFATATRAAAAGGVTTLMDMPLNSVPPTTTLAGLAAKIAAATGKLHVDVGFCGGLVPGNAGELHALRRMGALAFKCFLSPSGVDEFPHVDTEALRAGMRALAGTGATLLVHSELPGPLSDAERRHRAADPRDYHAWLDVRPPEAECEAVDLLLRLVAGTGAKAHVVHLSAARALPLLRRARDERLSLSAETCPHYLHFTAEGVPTGATAYKCAPPIREATNRERLWEALREGLISQVVTDHSPAEPAIKCVDSGDFIAAWGGIASLQLGLAAVWTEARARGFGLAEVSRWMSAAPAALVGLDGRKGRIAPGLDADFVVWDPEADFTVEPTRLFHRHAITPYAGERLRGRVIATYLRGEKVYGPDNHSDPPRGEVLTS